MENKGFINFDSDAEEFFLSNLTDMTNLETKAIEYFDEHYKDRGIGDILFEVFCQSSVTPSKVFTDRCEKYLQKTENGIAVDYSKNPHLSRIYECRALHGVSPTELWIAHCKQIGIRSWLSFRMNDNHYRDEDTCFGRSDFFYTALENGWMLGDKDKYRSGYRNFDYGVPRVREVMLNYIKEQLSAIDVYGIQLDFSREFKCLRYLDDPNVCEYMTSFIRGVREIVSECEKLHSHKIKLMTVLPRDINLAEKIGFDAKTWAKNGLIDIITLNSHWIGCDTGMPVHEWVEAMNPYGVEIYTAMEMNMPYRLAVNAQTAKGFTVQYADQGAKRTIVYNMYHVYLSYIKSGGFWDAVPTAEDIYEVWSLCGHAEKCRKGTRRHIVTQEMLGFDEVKPRWNPLPVTVNGKTELQIQTGRIDSDQKATLYVGVNGDIKNASVLCNGILCRLSETDKDAHILTNPTISGDSVFAFDIPGFNSNEITQTVTVICDDIEVFYLEMKISSVV